MKKTKITPTESVKKIEPTTYTFTLPKNFANILIALVLIAVSFLLGRYSLQHGMKTDQAQNGAVQPSQAPSKVKVDVGHFPVMGDKNAKVTIVEFADLRCPYCEQFFTQVEPQIIKDYVDTGKAKFAFRSYAFLGPASTVAHNAAECANEQGKFWEMHDYFYKNQPDESDVTMFTTDKLTEVAGTLGMDTAKFNSCLSSNKYDKDVSADFAAGQAAGVNGTPTVFINGTPIVGAQPYSAFKTAIDAELSK